MAIEPENKKRTRKKTVHLLPKVRRKTVGQDDPKSVGKPINGSEQRTQQSPREYFRQPSPRMTKYGIKTSQSYETDEPI